MRKFWNGVIVGAAALAAVTTHAAFSQPSTLNANPTPQSVQASARAAQQAALLIVGEAMALATSSAHPRESGDPSDVKTALDSVLSMGSRLRGNER